MLLRTVLAASCWVGSSLAIAQAGPPFVGSWKVSWQGDRRMEQARLVITESGGTWRSARSIRMNACVGRETPIALEPVSTDRLKVRLKFSEVLQGCPDSLITLRSADGQTITGMRGSAELTLERQ